MAMLNNQMVSEVGTGSMAKMRPSGHFHGEDKLHDRHFLKVWFQLETKLASEHKTAKDMGHTVYSKTIHVFSNNFDNCQRICVEMVDSEGFCNVLPKHEALDWEVH